MQGIVLFAVVIATVVMTFIQDRQTSAVMATFKKMLPAVRRRAACLHRIGALCWGIKAALS